MRDSIQAFTAAAWGAWPTRRQISSTSCGTSPRTLAQGGHLDPHLGDAEEEVGAEAAGVHLGGEIAAGGGDHAHVNGLEGVAPDALHLSLGERTEQLRLHLERPARPARRGRAVRAVGLGERPLASLVGAGEGAALVTEEETLGPAWAGCSRSRRRRTACSRGCWRRARRARPPPCRCPSRPGSTRLSGVAATFPRTLKTRRILGRLAYQGPEALLVADLDAPLGGRLEQQPGCRRP